MSLQLHGTARAGDLEVVVDLEVSPGETVALVGPNGAGKTTVLEVLAGLRPLTSGSLTLDGLVLDWPEGGVRLDPERRSVGVVFQDLLLFDSMDVVSNVAFGLLAKGFGRRRSKEAAREWLQTMSLGDRAHARPGELSGGEAQRVALARTLAATPRVLLLDEPLSALDADLRAGARRVLRRHLDQQEGPCLVVTHDLLDAAALADRVVVLEKGRISGSGTVDELVARPPSPWAAELTGTGFVHGEAAGRDVVLEGGSVLHVAEAPPEGPVVVAVRPSSISLHLQEPHGSPRNVWPATVAEVEGFAERVRVRLAPPLPLVAEVTTAAAREMAIAPGLHVWASVKATDVVAYQR